MPRKLGHIERPDFERHDGQPYCRRCAAKGIPLVTLPQLPDSPLCEHCAEVTRQYNHWASPEPADSPAIQASRGERDHEETDIRAGSRIHGPGD